MYVSALGANAIDRYATYLTSLGSTSTIEERRQALKLAENNGLNIIEVAQATAEKTMETAFEVLALLRFCLTFFCTLHSYYFPVDLTSFESCVTTRRHARNTSYGRRMVPRTLYRMDDIYGSDLPSGTRAGECSIPLLLGFRETSRRKNVTAYASPRPAVFTG